MCTLNVNAPIFIPSQQVYQPIFNFGEQACVRIIDSDEYRQEFLLNDFNREEVADEDL